MDSLEENLAALSTGEPDLQSSAMTGSASDESVSGGSGQGWLSDFRSIAWSLQQTAGGVANFVHRSAVAIADEIAQLEQEEMEKHHPEGNSAVDEHVGDGPSSAIPLPWEVPSLSEDGNGETYIQNISLKNKVQLLAESDSVFLGPYESKQDDSEFLDEARISLIRRLLEVDDRLARTHARLSGRSDVRETLFWKNYFYHVEKVCTAYMADSSGSLIPAEEPARDNEEPEEELTAFVQVPRPPESLNSLGVHSIDSMVVIDGAAAIPQDL